MLKICFLGKSIIEYDGKRIEDQLGAKAIALISILLLNEKRHLSREKLEGYLWPDSNTEAAKYNLRYNIWLIKKNIGPDENGNPFLRVDSNCCSINKEYKFICDIYDIMKFKPNKNDSIEELLRLKNLFRGDLLEGFYFKNCDELNDLIIFERMKFEQHNVRILKCLLNLYEKEKNYEECLKIIDEIHKIEPYDEEIVLKTLDIYVKYEKLVAAIAYYNNFSEMLVNSLGVFPSPKLRKKYDEIRSALSEGYTSEQVEEKEDINYKNSSLKNTLNITSDCIKDIEYFWISDVVGKIANAKLSDCINKLEERELLDLGYIQNDILKHCNDNNGQIYKGEVLGVNIVNAFIKLLKCICENYRLRIFISNSSDMDEISSNVLSYIRRINIEDLDLIVE